MKTLILLFALAAMILSCSSRDKVFPRLEIAGANRDLGRIPFDSTYTIVYPIRNGGTADLVIDTVSSSCGCSEPRISRKLLHPDDTASLLVLYKPVDTGIFRKSLVIRSNIDSSFSLVSFYGRIFR